MQSVIKTGSRRGQIQMCDVYVLKSDRIIQGKGGGGLVGGGGGG